MTVGVLVPHSTARALVQAVRGRALSTDEVATLSSYVSQREAASSDMKNTVKAVIDLFGPDGLMDVKARVERARAETGGALRAG